MGGHQQDPALPRAEVHKAVPAQIRVEAAEQDRPREIRDLSRALGLPTWDKPSFACLSSRFQYGDQITADKLRRVDAAEEFVRALGFRQFRVRHHDRLARLEIPLEDLPRLWEDGRHTAIVTRFRELGYLYVTVDLQGFRSGSANELLKWIAKK